MRGSLDLYRVSFQFLRVRTSIDFALDLVLAFAPPAAGAAPPGVVEPGGTMLFIHVWSLSWARSKKPSVAPKSGNARRTDVVAKRILMVWEKKDGMKD